MRPLIAVFVLAATLGSAGRAPAAPRVHCTPTPNGGGGLDRGPIPLRAKIGSGHVLTGVVLSTSCTPIAHAKVSFWQSNAKGIYTTAGRGAVMTDGSGRFRFEGPVPTAEGGRPAHIHIKVEARDYQLLYTEYEPHGATRGNIRLILVPAAL